MPNPAPKSSRTGRKAASLKGAFVTDRLFEELRSQILSGELSPGDPVLPVRELMKVYKISYNSVRRALAGLAEEGLVSLEQGRGTFVKDRSAASASAERPAVSEPADSASPPPAPSPAPPPTEAPMEAPSHGVAPRPAELVAISGRRSIVLLYPALASELFGTYGYDDVLRGVQQAVLENGEALTLLTAHRRRALPTPNALKEGGFGGAVLLGAPEPALLYAFSESSLPSVLLDHWPDDLAVNGVLFDHFSGGYLLAKHLVNAGHRELCFVRAAGGGASGVVSEQEAGCRLALKEEGCDLREGHLLEDEGGEGGSEDLAARVLGLRPRPTAAVVAQEPLAQRLCERLHQRGVRVPRELSVVCFGAKDRPAPGGLTAARASYVKMGESGVSRLRQLMAGAPASRLRINIPVEIVPGRTVAPPLA